MRPALALALWFAGAGLAGAETCALNSYGAPEAAFTFPGVARGPATPEEVASQTAIAVRRAHAPESPKYAHLPRAFVYYMAGGRLHGTIAAVTDGKMPQRGQKVMLASRRRDPDSPCAFIPWTIVPATQEKPTI